MPEYVCPKGHGSVLTDGLDRVPSCEECGAELVPVAAIVYQAEMKRTVILAYEAEILPVDRAIPDLQIEPEEGETLSVLVVNVPPAQRYAILVGDAQARKIVKGLVDAHGVGPSFGVPQIVVPDTIPPDLRG